MRTEKEIIGWSDIVRGKKTFSKDLDAKILRLDGVEKRNSRWGHKVAYWTSGREFAHFQGEKVIDIRITRKEETRMRKTDHCSRVVFRPRTSDWIKFELRARRDVDEAFNLVKIALTNNRMDGLH